jgi:arabinose-5-phosphate isomerase
MNAVAQAVVPLSPTEQLAYAAEIIRLEGQALFTIANRLKPTFCDAVQILYQTAGNAIVTGMGKAGLIGQKISATFASTGTRSHFLHPADAIHGDLGRIHSSDTMIVLSQSGETEEIVRLLPSLEALRTRMIAITSSRESTLARAADVVLELGPLQEACSLGLAPSTSTTAMAAMGDALALVVSRMKRFTSQDFARYHPGGSLGRQLMLVEDKMRPLSECRVALDEMSVREVFVRESRPSRRSGAIMLRDAEGRLTGIFTDSDLARLFESKQDAALDRPIRDVMTANPRTCPSGAMLNDAVEIMAERKISELPVVDRNGHPIGLLDITDVVGVSQNRAIPPPKQAVAQPDQDWSSTIPISNHGRRRNRT